MAKARQKAQTTAPQNHHTPPAAPASSGNWQPFYRVDQAAAALGLAEATVRKYASQGKLVSHKQAGRLYFLHCDLMLFITGK